MECNKEEAEKCKAISEVSLKKFDLVAARRFALKAKKLFPELEGLAQLTSILDVYIAAHEKLQNGEGNWYAILQVDFRADENTIRKQYRKLALYLHPDKNKAFGAEAAFKHISQAWSVLSDGKKKKDYDKRWFAHMASQRSRYTFPNSPAFRARGNLSKQPMHAARHPHRHVHQNHSQMQSQQGQGQGYVNQHPYKQQEPAKAYAQGQSPADAQQQQWQDQPHGHQQQGNVHGHTYKKGRAHVHQQQAQGQAPVQLQGQTPAHQQEGPGQAHAHQQQQQGQNQKQGQGQACAHQKLWQDKAQTQQQGQGQEYANQQQGHPHKQQEPYKAHAQGQSPADAQQQQWQDQSHGHQQQGNAQGHTYKRQGQGQAHVHQQQAQGQAPVQQQGQAPAHQQEGPGQAHAQQQQQDQNQKKGQGQACAHQKLRQDKAQTQQQGQGQEYVNQQQGHPHKQQEPDKAHAQGQSPADAQQQQWQDQPHGHQQQGNVQGHTYKRQGQGQGQAHVHQQQAQGQAPVQQQGQAHAHQQEGPGQAHAQQQQGQNQKQGQGQACAHHQKLRHDKAQTQQQRQGEVLTHQKQEQCELQQEGQGQAHAHQQQLQGQACAHQKLRQDKSQTQQQGQGEVLTHQKQEQCELHVKQKGQGQAHAHQQQRQGQAQTGKVHVQQEAQNQAHAHQQQGEGQAQQQGQGQAHVQQQRRGEAHVSQKGQCEAHVPQQGQGQEYGQLQQGHGQAYVHQQRETQHDALRAEHNRTQKPALAHDKSAFWTACPSCKMQLEYERAYMNKNLCCPMCYKPFVSKEIEPIQGAILWPPPMQQHKEASEKDAGNKSCTVDRSDCTPLADSDMHEIVHSDKKAKRGENDKFSEQKCPKPSEDIAFEDKKTLEQNQEWKGKVRIQKNTGLRTKRLKKLLARMKEVVDQECTTERGNPAADKLSADMNRCNVADRASASVQNIPGPFEPTDVGNVELKTNDADKCNSRVRNCNSAGTKESRSISAFQTTISGPVLQNTPAASEQKVVDNSKGKSNDADECSSRVRIHNSIGSKEVGGSFVASNTAAEQAPRPSVQNISAETEQKSYVHNMKVKGNDDDECNSRVRTRNSARNKIGGSSLTAADQPHASSHLVQNILAASDQEANVGDIEGRANNVNHSNLRVRTRHSVEIRGLQKGSCLRKLGSSNMEISQQKRKLVSSTIDGLEDSSTVKRQRQNIIQDEPASKSAEELESRQLLKYRKSSDRSSLQVDVADDLGNECEMEVPDADFYNFDEDRTEKRFAVGQIWATYDDDDGMPRYYARVNKILIFQPLKMQMNWLEARNPTDETMAWLDAGFQHSCGDFKLGSTYVAEQVSTFSHLMTVDKASKGGYKIYPRQGDVWAVYKEWELLKVRDDNRGYDMVEIIATFDEKRGVQVAPLVKVAGFKTVFERKLEDFHMKWIPLHEIRRFSHQVPAHRIVAGKVPGIQVDCLEIDPASTPMNLIIGEQ